MSKEFRFAYFTPLYDRTVAFLREALEFPVLGSWDRPGDHRGTLFSAASATIEVLESGEEPSERPSGALPDGPFMVIEVDDVDALHERLAAKGVPIHAALRDKPWGHRGFSVLEPNGIEIAFFSWIQG
jgi:catechol 2,3-dioxygenase-like lactoylglutathione lyase family enzyme